MSQLILYIEPTVLGKQLPVKLLSSSYPAVPTQYSTLCVDIATGYTLVYLQEDLSIIMAQSSGKHDPVKL